MQKLVRVFSRFPLGSAIVMVFALIFFTQVGTVIMGSVFPQIGTDYFGTLFRMSSGLVVIFLLYRLSWERDSFITTPMHQWGEKWFWFALPLMSLGFINLFNVNWDNVVFSWSTFVFWGIDNLSTGVFEETMMRAIAFGILLKAWGGTKAGIYKAAIAQAVIFGSVHLLNLINGFAFEVLAQVIYATFIGFGFAGAVIYTRSIWPAVFIHGFINAMANINLYFEPDYVRTPNEPLVLAALVVYIFIMGVGVGHWGIRQYWQDAKLRDA